MMARKTIPSSARLSLTALEPNAIPSANACTESPMVVLDRPCGESIVEMVPETTRSSLGDVGTADNGTR